MHDSAARSDLIQLTFTKSAVAPITSQLELRLSPQKIILVKKEDLSPAVNSIEEIRKIYSNKIEIVSEEEIINAIENKIPGTVILHKVGPVSEKQNKGYCFKMLIGTDDAIMYYYNVHTIDKNNPNGLLPADLKRLARFE